MSNIELLIAYGFSVHRANIIAEDAERGIGYALAWLDLARQKIA